MRGSILAILLFIGAWRVAGDTTPHPKYLIPMKIAGLEQGKVWAQPTFPPLMSFRVRSGKVPEKGTVQLCVLVNDRKYLSETDVVNTISLHCEEGLIMELEGIDLQGGQ